LVPNPFSYFLQFHLSLSGKLSSAQIKAGYAALKDIETYIKANNFNAAFIEANNTYYTRSICIIFFLILNKNYFVFSST